MSYPTGSLFHWVDGDVVYYGTKDHYDEWLKSIGEKQHKPVTEQRAPACECGSESAGSYHHSTWCPKFEK